ncbi:3-keto-5-aminohexanoate cleavage protein [Deinococcus sp.]|uniref:3-keto-5-aminohexanoate cleavage protein n=1 Tax=Deinococcus sp. TaxID=47478 RepID=UPI003C7C39E5
MRRDAAALRLQACLNGARPPGKHPALPQTLAALAADAHAVERAGAEALHLHLWHGEHETLEAQVLQDTLRAVREATPSLPVGVSTGLWIVSTAAERLRVVESWATLRVSDRPDFGSVNFLEEGAAAVCELLLGMGIGIEAGLESVADVERLERSGLADRCLRWLIELPPALNISAALTECGHIHERLDLLGTPVTRLTHGADANAWALLAEAKRRGDAARIGLEDVLRLPDGSLAPDNAALVRTALAYPPG